VNARDWFYSGGFNSNASRLDATGIASPGLGKITMEIQTSGMVGFKREDQRPSAEISGEKLLTPEQRALVVQEAREWVTARTPYRPHAKLKGIGCDCATFILCVYRDLGLVEDVDHGAYSIQAHLHKPLNEAHERLLTQYVDTILRYADEIPEAEAQPGDMVLFKTAHAFAHGAIVINWPNVVHSCVGHGVMFADVSTDPHLKGRERRFFRRNFLKPFTTEDTKEHKGEDGD
jgi:cell wall-associated NlpC family hydrolase